MNRKHYKLLTIIFILIIFFFLTELFPYICNILKIISKILFPFIISLFIAFIFEPFVKFLELKKIKRQITVIIINVFLIVSLIVFFRLFIPFIIKQIMNLSEMLPQYIDRIEQIASKIDEKISLITKNYQLDYDKIELKLVEFFEKFVKNIIVFLQDTFSYLFTIIMIPVLVIYFMNDYNKIEEYVKKILNDNKKDKLYSCLKEIKISLRQYIRGTVVVMIILTLTTFTIFKILNIEYAFLLALFIGITDIIPYIGPYIGGGIAGIFTLATKPNKFLYVLISIIGIQFVESNFLVPKIQSKTLKTNPLFVLFSIALFGELFGIFGIIIAVPAARIVEIIFSMIYQTKKRKK